MLIAMIAVAVIGFILGMLKERYIWTTKQNADRKIKEIEEAWKKEVNTDDS